MLHRDGKSDLSRARVAGREWGETDVVGQLSMSRAERGLGAVGFIFVLLVIAGAATLVIKLVPHYLDHYALIRSLEQLDDATLRKPKSKIYDDLEKKVFDINAIYNVKPRDWIKVEKTRSRVIFYVDYQIEEPVVGQAGLYVHFKRSVVRSL